MLRKLLIITCLSTTVLVAYADKKNKSKNETAQKEGVDDTSTNHKVLGSPMPRIYATTAKNEKITTKDMANDANLFVMLFNPTCEHCQDETRLIMSNMDKFQKSKVLLLATDNMMSYLSFFDATTGVNKEPRIKVAIDSANFVNKTFTYDGLPQINIYNKERVLIKQFHGDQPMDSLARFIE
ncbi:MAG: redoxin domain-containing protein [Sphingobacteriales bacterium]|nr:MAG: redoxin domain-containing protein [Sphingobacteriales bacterium]